MSRLLPDDDQGEFNMSGLLPDDEVRNKTSKIKWKKSERDRGLNRYFAGGHPKEIGIALKGAPKAFQNSILNKLKSNYKGRAERYRPFRRDSRKGKRLTPNELHFIKAHREHKIDPVITARILCRDVEEITQKTAQGVCKNLKLTTIAPTLDLIWAHRYIHFVYKTPIITDEVYDKLVSEEAEFGGGGPAFEKIKNHQGWPLRIKSLAMYLIDRAKDESGGS